MPDEIFMLKALWAGEGSDEQRRDLLELLAAHPFAVPEHQVVFESIRSLPGANRSLASLTVHLNNRGFPDLDLDKLFSGEAPSVAAALAKAQQIPANGL